MTLTELLIITFCGLVGTLLAHELSAHGMLAKTAGFLIGTIGSMLVISGLIYLYERRRE